VKHFHHGLLVDFHHGAIRHCGRRAKAERLPCRATFSEKIAPVQNAYCGFLPDLRHNGEFYLSFLYIKNSIGRVALSKDRLPFGKGLDLSTAVDGRKECLSIEFDEFLGLVVTPEFSSRGPVRRFLNFCTRLTRASLAVPTNCRKPYPRENVERCQGYHLLH
jgi:hypothetical protein